MWQTTPLQTRHPELVSGSISRFTRTKRGQAQPNGKVTPLRVMLIDQIDLPRPVPALELLFAQNSGFHLAKQFIVDQPVDFVPRGKPRQRTVAVLPKAGKQVGRNPHVKRAVVPARQDIDARKPLLSHWAGCAAKWTLKQVQGDELGSKWLLPLPRHAELVSASIVQHIRSAPQ